MLNEILQWLAIFALFGVLLLAAGFGWNVYQEHRGTIERVNELSKYLKVPTPGPLPLPWSPFREVP